MFVEREIRSRFDLVEKSVGAVAVVGARQSGKTTFLKDEMKRRKAAYVLFDNPDARRLFESDVRKFETQYMEGAELTVLDELQYCKDAGQNLKYLVDSGRRVWLTSSSETILGKNVLSFLVGRVAIIRMFPFSLAEFLVARGQRETTREIARRLVWEHATYGGYPAIALAGSVELKRELLRGLYETMILKDVARTFAIDDQRALEDMVRYLALNTTGLLSYENLSRDLKISTPTIQRYLDALEKSYLLARVPPYYTNPSREIVKLPKIFFIDTGMRNRIANRFDNEPDGPLYENYVYTELVKLGYAPKYWRTKTKIEVDFVIEKNNSLIPIEVKLNAEPGRIETGLRAFINAYSPKTALVVAYQGENGETKIGGCAVKFVDALEMRKTLGTA